MGKHLALLFDPTYYNVHQNKENQRGLVQEQKLETQSKRCETAIIFHANRITNVNEFNKNRVVEIERK